MTESARAWLVRVGITAGVAVLSFTGMQFDCVSPWAYLNVAAGVALTIAAWRLGLQLWFALALLPVWQAVEVSMYYPWGDPGIPISMFLNPILGVMIAPLVLASDVSAEPKRVRTG